MICDIGDLLRENSFINNCVANECPCTKGYVSIQGMHFDIDVCRNDLGFAHELMIKRGCSAAPSLPRLYTEEHIDVKFLSRDDFLLLAYVATIRGVNVSNRQSKEVVELKAVKQMNSNEVLFVDSNGVFVFETWR